MSTTNSTGRHLTPQQLVDAVRNRIPGPACTAMAAVIGQGDWNWISLETDVLEGRPGAYEKLLRGYMAYLEHRILRG